MTKAMTRATARAGHTRLGEEDVRRTMRVSNRTQHDGPQQWYRIENKSSDTTEVFIMDEIGFWGTTADGFVRELQNISTPNILLHLNSPGGEVFDGVAIYNALRDHSAFVTVKVDALAASAASFIAQAGDKIVMSRGSTMMIHDGLAFCVGNESDMLKTATLLSKISDNVADIYANRAGGTTESWRALMREEVWYTAQEAVDAGLADEIAPDPAPKEAVEATNQWDLSVFNHAGRKDAPSPDEVKRIISNRAKEAPVASSLPHAEADKSGEEQTPVAPATQVVPEQPGTPSDPLPEVNPPEGDEAEADNANPTAPKESPSNKAGNSTGPHLTFMVNGVSTTDPSVVQAHITSLESFRKETQESNRRDFVKSLADRNMIGASQMSKTEEFVLGLTSEQYEAWKSMYDSAPVLPLLGQHAAGSTNHDGDMSAREALKQDEVSIAKETVMSHKRGGMSHEKIKQTASYQKLIALVPDFQL